MTAIQNIRMRPSDSTDSREERFVIPAHTLYGNYPPKIPEDEIKPVNETGEIVLSRVVVPEYIVVHDGSPRDSTARNYYVKYKDYIKNVASSEIYATWPANTIRANVLAIMSFTLNRVYTNGTGTRAMISPSPPPRPLTTNGSPREMCTTPSPSSWMSCSQIISHAPMCASPS